MRHRLAMHSSLVRACVAATACACLATILVQAQGRGPQTPIPKGTNVLLGRVLDTGTGAPIGDAVVTLIGFFDPSGNPTTSFPTSADVAGASAARSAMTTSNGYFSFRDLPAGRYSVAVQAFGYGPNNYPPHIVDLTNGDKPAMIDVRLWKFGAIAGTVRDEQGDPLAGVTVSALERATSGAGVVLRSVVSVQTDDRGVYRLTPLRPGSFVVGVVATTTTIPASLAGEVDALALERPGMSPLSGRLLPSGTRLSSGEGVRVGDAVIQQTGPVLPLSPDGRMLAYSTTYFPATGAAREASTITIGSGEERPAVDLALRLSPTVRVSGVVTGPTGPMRNMAVRLFPPGAHESIFEATGAVTAVTDEQGAFTFLGVTPGSYTLNGLFVPGETGAEMSLWATDQVTVGDADITGLAVTMKPGIRISGRIEFKNPAGAPVSIGQGSSIMLRPMGAQMWRTGRSQLAADGTFQTAGDPPGRYFLSFYMPGWTIESIARDGRPIAGGVIDLETTNLAGFVVTFTNKPSRVTGSVVDAKGTTEARDVIVFPADTTLWREDIFDDARIRLIHATFAGAFEFTGLAPGDYYIAALGAGLIIDWQDLAILERLMPSATRFTLGSGEERTLQLKTITPRGR